MPINHVVVLMLENRSFDHLLGDLPNVAGINRTQPYSNTQPYTRKRRARRATSLPTHSMNTRMYGCR